MESQLCSQLYIPDEGGGAQCTAYRSNPVYPVMVPVVVDHCRTEGSGRVHAGSRHRASETAAGTNNTVTQRLTRVTQLNRLLLIFKVAATFLTTNTPKITK